MPSELTVPVSLVRKIVAAAIDEAIRGTRVPKVLTGSVEDLTDETLDVAYIRMDAEAMGSDPTQSDNWGMPGIIPTTRLGDAVTGEQVRVTFDPLAGASAIRTAGTGLGQRMTFDSTSGVISFWNDADQLVGYLDATTWAIGAVDSQGARVTLDPYGGLRLRSDTDVLTTIIDQAGYSLRDTLSGLVVAEMRPGVIRVVDPDGIDDIELVTSSAPSLPNPRWTSAVEANPGASIVVPSAAPVFTTIPAADISVGHVAAWLANTVQAGTWTPPGGWTERVDDDTSPDDSTLAVSVATLGATAGAAGTFTSSQTNWQQGIGTHVVLRGGGAVSPTFRSETHTASVFTTGTSLTFTLAKPVGVVAGDVLIAFVAMGNDGGFVPTGWTTPDGWVFLGANIAGSATNSLAVGAWVKLAGASEPSTYEVSIQFGAGAKTLHACMVAVQDVDLVDGGAHIRIAGHPIRRLLAKTELAADNRTLCDFQNIPSGFDHLEVIYNGQSGTGTGPFANIVMQFNGDTGANYHWQRNRDNTITSVLSTSALVIGALDDANTGQHAAGRVQIYDYTWNERRTFIGDALHFQAGSLAEETDRGQWLNTTTAINRIVVQTDQVTCLFNTGARAFLYGY